MKTVEEILKKIDTLDNLEKYQEIIDMIEELPVEQLNNQIISEQGRAYNNIGEYEKAIEILKTIETEEKGTRRWNYRIAYSYYFLEDYENAEKYFLKANEIGPEDDEIKNYLLNIYIDLSKKHLNENKEEEAIEYALKAKDYITNDENKVHVYSYLAWMYDRIEAYDIAEDLLKSILNCKTDQRNEIWAYSELGYCLGEQHRYQESLEALIKASEMGRDDIWLNTQIGWTYRILGNYEEALQYLFKAREMGRDDEWINAELGICYKETEKYEEALQYYLLANEQNGQKNIWVLSEIAWLYGVLDKYEDELKYLDRVKKLGRKDEWINAEYGKVHARIGKYEEALKYFRKAKKMGQDDAWINIQMAICFKRLNKLKKALEYYLLAEKFKDYKKDIWLYTEYGFCLMRMKKYKEAITKYKKGLKLKEELNEEIFLNSQIGFCYRLLGSEKTALKYHLKARELGRNDAWINTELGICYKELDKYEKALECYLLAYKEEKEEIWLLSDIGWIFNELDKYEEALEFLLKAEELGRDDAWINAEIGQCLGRLEKLDEGIDRLKRALELLEEEKSNNTTEKIFINSEIGRLIGKKEISNPEEALHYLNIAKELGRDDIWINSEIAWELAYNDNKSEESIKYFEKAIKLGRKDEWIWSRVANVYFDLERIKDAFNAYSKAYKLAKKSWYICNIGRCLRKLGKYEEAVKKLVESRKLSLKEGDVVDLEDLELAYCYAALGDKKKAEKHMKLSIDSLGSRAENEEHLKEQFDEIKEMISVLSKPS